MFLEMSLKSCYSIIANGVKRYRDGRLDKALVELEENGVSADDLMRTDYRFAHFMTFVKALETCASNEMFEYLKDVLMAGFSKGEVDERPDVFQLVLSSLGGLTKLEVDIIAHMHWLQMYGDDESNHTTCEASRALESWCDESFDINKDLLSSIMNGLTKSGFVTVQPPSRGRALEHEAVCSRSSYYLTGLARELVALIHYKNYLQ